jgi:hypothetical protein
MIRLVVSEGERRGRANCTCGCSFAWSQQTDLNILYKMSNGNLIILIRCPNCFTTINGPVI